MASVFGLGWQSGTLGNPRGKVEFSVGFSWSKEPQTGIQSRETSCRLCNHPVVKMRRILIFSWFAAASLIAFNLLVIEFGFISTPFPHCLPHLKGAENNVTWSTRPFALTLCEYANVLIPVRYPALDALPRPALPVDGSARPPSLRPILLSIIIAVP
jgi:hypothetical protein